MKGTVNIPAVAVILRDKNKVLFLLRQNTGWKDGFYTLPAGHVEHMESFAQAAIRELKEEVGLTVIQDDLIHRLTMHESKQSEGQDEVRIGVMFEVEKWNGEPYNAEPDVHSEMVWLDQDNLPDNVVPFTRLALREIAAGKNYAEFGWEA